MEQKTSAEQQENTPKTDKKTTNDARSLLVSIQIKMNMKKCIYKQYKRILHPSIKTQLNKIANEIKDLNNHYNDIWKKRLDKINKQPATSGI